MIAAVAQSSSAPVVRERPLLFSAPMVRAVLAGQKTQTRRMVTRLTSFGPVTEFGESTTPGYAWTFRNRRKLWNDISGQRLMECCPYGKPGDRLWVKENWSPDHKDVYPMIPVVYQADGKVSDCDRSEHVSGCTYERDERQHFECLACVNHGKGLRWRPSIHMPRRHSRITLEVADVRVQRLLDITEEDAIAEGVVATEDRDDSWKVLCEDGSAYDCFVEPDRRPGDGIHAYVKNAPLAFLNRTAVQNYARLWDEINGAGAWALNPWVWCVSFRRCA